MSSYLNLPRSRCFGNKEFYARYHDEEWGTPLHEDQKLLELLILEGCQAGLSWEIILKRREAYKKSFHHFDPQKVAEMGDEELERLCLDASIIRNRLKIFAARQNAKTFLAIQKEFGSFDSYLWAYVKNRPIINRWKTLKEIPCSSPLSDALSKDLKNRGMTFVGTKIIYSFLQAAGLIDDHLDSCWRKSLFIDEYQTD